MKKEIFYGTILKKQKTGDSMAKKNILFVTSEAVPFVKTGGLADVAGTLPEYFNKNKLILLPWQIKEAMEESM